MTRSEFVPVLIANIIGWPIIHMGAAWVGIRLPASSFRPESMWFHEFAWERGGRFYERVFRIKAWKDLLPDGAAWIPGGFRKKKKNLQDADRSYLARFVVETCRGEAVHWWTFCCFGIFFLWNPLWAALVMLTYAIVANAPCILVQRYNRARLRRLLDRKSLGGATL